MYWFYYQYFSSFFSYFYLAQILQIVYYNFINTGVDKLLQKESKTLILATDEL